MSLGAQRSEAAPSIQVDRLALDAPEADAAEIERIASESGTPIDTAAELGRAWSHVWVARLEDAIAGFCLAWDVADEVHLLDLGTDARFRRRGVASGLLRAMIEHGRCRKARLVLLEVRRTNQVAFELYRAHGFRVVGERRGYYRDTGEDAILMMLALDTKTEEWLKISRNPAVGER